MGLSRSEMDRMLDEHFNCEATDNIEGVLSTLTTDVTHDIVGWPTGPTEGRGGRASLLSGPVFRRCGKQREVCKSTVWQ
jgi:hypothetical protein